MCTHHVLASARIEAAPARVYAVIADYRHGRRRILAAAFCNLAVERGGVGAGTVVRFETRRGGRTRPLRAAVTEPEPGRVLVETHLEGPMAATSFTVEPAESGAASKVTVAAALATNGGPLGMIERFLATRRLRKRYEEELRRLTDLVAGMESARVS
jgi:Polyketide cyclase / dehydrase and lipid transport